MNHAAVVEAADLRWKRGYFAERFGRRGETWSRVRLEHDIETDAYIAHYLNTHGERLLVVTE